MVFNSFAFLIFAIVVLAVYTMLRGRPLRVWLVCMSYVFYGWANPWYIFLLIISTVLDFTIGLRLANETSQRNRKRFLTASLIGNLGLLGVFKYSGFAVRSLNDILAALGVQSNLVPPDILLPVGISFYTFQTLSYTIDVYRRKLEPTRSFTTFALYVAFFPQLVAGPIERATHLLHQLKEKRVYKSDDVLQGFSRVLWGLSKKVVFADRLGWYVATIYNNLDRASNTEIVLATYAFAFQIYLDFSAYSDIAIGLARMMGIHLRENFRWPYLARNISEFWQRWHISLSTWLRDYLYIPLGGSRRGTVRTAINLVVVMFLGGLWHGADLKFIVWGLWLGGALGVYHTYATVLKKNSSADDPFRLWDLIGIVVTFHVVWVSWVFFRADSTTQALHLLRGFMEPASWAKVDFFAAEYKLIVLAVLGMTGGLHILRGLGVGRSIAANRSPVAVGIFWGLLIIAMLLFHAPGERFIYFRF